MKVSELEGFDLDYWAAMAVCWGDGEGQGWFSDGTVTLFPGWVRDQVIIEWMPHKRWEDGGPLLEQWELAISPVKDGWFCTIGIWDKNTNGNGYGNTLLEAACRAIVDSVYGDHVPEE